VSLTTGELQFQNGFDLKFFGARMARKASHRVTIYFWIFATDYLNPALPKEQFT
jgi:hypothetical protein